MAFDDARVRLLSMPEVLAAASYERRAEIVALLVERGRRHKTTGLVALEWAALAAPIFRLGFVREGRVGQRPIRTTKRVG